MNPRALLPLLLLLTLASAGAAEGPPDVTLLGADDRPVTLRDLCGQRGALLLILKPFPGAHEGALRTLGQLPPRCLRRPGPHPWVVFSGTSLPGARLYLHRLRVEPSFVCDPEGRLLSSLDVRNLPAWVRLTPDGRPVEQAGFLGKAALLRLWQAAAGTPDRRRRHR